MPFNELRHSSDGVGVFVFYGIVVTTYSASLIKWDIDAAFGEAVLVLRDIFRCCYEILCSRKSISLKAEREKRIALEEAVAVQAQQIAELKPKASYYDVVLKCKDAVNISIIAKDYGWSAQRMNEYLHQKGVQYKQADIWLLYQKHAGCGYTKTNTHVYEDTCGREHTKVHTKWTQKGRLFIYELLKADGVYPQIEMED